jgi:hypothetical protein
LHLLQEPKSLRSGDGAEEDLHRLADLFVAVPELTEKV